MIPCIYNLCAHTIKVQMEAPKDGPFDYSGGKLTKEFKSDQFWRGKWVGEERMANVLGVPAYLPGEFVLEPLSVTLPLDVPVVLIVSMLVGQTLERMNPYDAKKLLQDHPRVTIVCPASGGPTECARLENGQVDVSFMWKRYIPGRLEPALEI